MSPSVPKAFISYSHDSAEHDERVREARVQAVAAIFDGKIVVAGDQAGRVHFFDLVEPE